MKEVLELALEALEEFGEHYDWCHQFPTYAFPENYPPCNCGYDEAITAIKEALAQPEQESCRHRIADIRNEAVKSGYMCMDCGALFGAYNTSPQRTWVRLTDEEIEKVWDSGVRAFPLLARQLEAKLKQKNGYAEEKNT